MSLEFASRAGGRACATVLAFGSVFGLATIGAAPVHAQGSPPHIANVTPSASPTQGGARMTIFGSRFGASPGVVLIDDREVAIPSSAWTSGTIELDIPEGDPGPASVQVRPPVGSPSNVWQQFAYDPPTLSELLPGGGPARGGVPITIHGTNFGTASASITARMGGKIALCTRVSHEELHVTPPTLPPGTLADTWVEVEGLATGMLSYDVEPPVITDISPTPGPTQGGLLITITGSNFGQDGEDPLPAVEIAGAHCEVVHRENDSEIQVLTAPGAGANAPLVARVGTGRPGLPFPYAYMRPYIGATEPAPGPAFSNFPITIFGANFGPPGTAVEARLGHPGPGTTVATCQQVDHGRALCDVPELPPGTYALEMLVVDQLSDPVPYVIGGTPVITNVVPFEGPTEGGTLITIYGENFGGLQDAVHLGPWECFISSWSPEAIECFTPPGYGGIFELRVQTAGGPESDPSYFSYLPPRLLEVDPMFLSPAGGQVITLRGENFGIAAAPLVVEFAGEPATLAQWVSHHEVRVTSPPGAPNQVGLACVWMGPGGEGDASCEDIQYGNPVAVDPLPPPALPTAFALRLAGANPSRGATAFAVDLPRDARYALTLFDASGRLERRFAADGAAGTQVVRWDGADERGLRARAGLYWARLEVGGESFVRKVMRF